MSGESAETTRRSEHDRTFDARLRGYRLNIEPAGSRALRECLPPDLWEILVATAGDPGPGMGVFDERLRELVRESENAKATDPADGTHAGAGSRCAGCCWPVWKRWCISTRSSPGTRDPTTGR